MTTRARTTAHPASGATGASDVAAVVIVVGLGGGEVMVILPVALIMLGPTNCRSRRANMGNLMGESRRMCAGVDEELRTAVNDATAKPASADIKHRKT